MVEERKKRSQRALISGSGNGNGSNGKGKSPTKNKTAAKKKVDVDDRNDTNVKESIFDDLAADTVEVTLKQQQPPTATATATATTSTEIVKKKVKKNAIIASSGT